MANKRVTIKDIANHLGVSYGIINKAINNKSGISEAMKKKILDAADELGYKVNKVAQCMARSTIVIGVVIPTNPPEQYSVAKKAIDKEFERLMDYNVRAIYYKVKNVNSVREIGLAFKKCVKDSVHGIVMYAVPPFGMDQVLNELEGTDIKVTIIGHPSLESEKIICSVHTDAYRSGQIAAHMMALMAPLESNIIVFVGNKNDPEHRLKVEGFISVSEKFRMHVKHINVVGVFETLDSYDIMNQILKNSNSLNEHIRGIYCTTSNLIAACEYIRDKGEDIKIVGSDINHHSVEFIKNRILDCVIYQDTKELVTTAIKAMYEYLAERKEPPKAIEICPQIVISSNIDGIYKEDIEEDQ